MKLFKSQKILISMIDLKEFRDNLEVALGEYAQKFDLTFKDFPNFKRTENKPTYARTIVPVESVGDMYVIIFRPYDGTGDAKSFPGTGIPSRLYQNVFPARVIPRSKEGVLAEGYFPFFNQAKDEYVGLFAGHLDELTLEDGEIVPRWQLGQNKSEFLKAINTGSMSLLPRIQYTVNESFGDPHAIYNSTDVVQVAGFLSIKEESLLKITEKWDLPITL